MARGPRGTREQALARAIIGETLRVGRGESVAIEAWTHSLPWATACAEEAVARGALPIVLYHDEESFWRLIGAGRVKELGLMGDHEHAALSKTDVYVYFEGPEDRGRYHGLPEAARRQLEAWEEKWWSTVRKSGTRIAWILLGRAVAGSARYHGVPLGAWREELFHASLVDPATMRREGERIARRFSTGKKVVITHPNGTHLELRLSGRAPAIHDGRLDAADVQAGQYLEEVPSGYVPVSLDERYAEGRVRSNVRALAMDGKTRIEGGDWEFKNGHLVGFRHQRGHAEIAREFEAAPAEGRDRPGILSIGLNPKISMAPLVADQRRGRVMFMIGGNRSHGGLNANPFRAYLLLDGATVEVDGRAVLRDGRIV
ncbi:MAG TPA: aminopeptidase [Thermoplasmata archaeon]|nr:aminopeptidase [Thermoplasmata archaeon]